MMAIKFETIEPGKAKKSRDADTVPPPASVAAPAPVGAPAGELALGQDEKPEKPKRKRK